MELACLANQTADNAQAPSKMFVYNVDLGTTFLKENANPAPMGVNTVTSMDAINVLLNIMLLLFQTPMNKYVLRIVHSPVKAVHTITILYVPLAIMGILYKVFEVL